MDSSLITMMMAGFSYWIGFTVRGYAEYEYACDCEKIIPFELLNNINGPVIEENIRLKKELHIALDYINYTNIGNSYYDYTKDIEIEADNVLVFPHDKFIADFYEVKVALYKSVMDLIESKRELYMKYMELKNKECFAPGVMTL